MKDEKNKPATGRHYDSLIDDGKIGLAGGTDYHADPWRGIATDTVRATDRHRGNPTPNRPTAHRAAPCITLDITKTDDGEHFILTAGGKRIVVHNIVEATVGLTGLLYDRYSDFFGHVKRKITIGGQGSHEEHLKVRAKFEEKENEKGKD